jgi:RNA polymerase sigma-70 factor (ECF subfamily)
VEKPHPEPGGTEWLAQRFEENRAHLRSVAYRMLGSIADAEDAVQEAWLRLSGAENSHIDNMRGWLTTVVSRICLDMLRSRSSKREESLDTAIPDFIVSCARGFGRFGAPGRTRHADAS